MSAHLDAPAYHRRPCPVPPAPVDATALMSAELVVLRGQLAYVLGALRHTRNDYAALMQFAGCCEATVNAKLAAADAALEQFEGVS